MKVCVCGSRDFTDYERACPIIYGFFHTFVMEWKIKGEIVSGCARGADAIGEQFAKSHGLKCHRFPANWEKHGTHLKSDLATALPDSCLCDRRTPAPTWPELRELPRGSIRAPGT